MPEGCRPRALQKTGVVVSATNLEVTEDTRAKTGRSKAGAPKSNQNEFN
jgi:hypothetical protein